MSIAKRILAIIALLAIVVSLGLINGAAVGRADDEAEPQEAIELAAGAPLLVSYQGRLEDSTTGAAKPDGNYSMAFGVYSAASGGSALWSESQTVSVTSGLFTVYLGSVNPLSAGLFNGTERYLEVSVGGATLSPRQRLTAAPYAIQATEAMTASYATNADTVDGQHASAFATSSHGHDATYVNVSGDNMTGPLTVSTSASTAISATGDVTGVRGYGFFSVSGIPLGVGVRGEGNFAGVSGESSMNGVYGDGSYAGVYGSGGDYGVYGTGDYSGVFGSGGDYGFGGYFYNTATTTPTLYIRHNNASGNIIEAYGAGSGDVEFYVTNGGTVVADGQFVSGVAQGTPPLVVNSTTKVDNLNADLLDGQHASQFIGPTGGSLTGPLTVSTSAATAISATSNSTGVSGRAYGSYMGIPYGIGVRGEGNYAGVRGEGGMYGLYGDGYANGVYGESDDTGVRGSGGTYGVYGSGLYGVYGESTYKAVDGSGGSTGYGGYFYNNALYTPTLYVRNQSTAALIEGYGSSTSDTKFRVMGNGNVYGDGAYSSPAGDFAELMAVEGDLASYAPGDVLCVSPSAIATVVRCAEANSTAVIGVYSTKPGFVGGSPLDGDSSKIPVAVVGIVPVKASAENGAIRPGDLLTAASITGYAMKANSPLPGTVLGKALQPLESGSGVISVMITLR